MKRLLLFVLIVGSFVQGLRGQALAIDSTRFITGLRCCTAIQYAVPTTDKGIFFAGMDNQNPGGIIPYFPYDTSTFTNVLIGKVDSNQQISWLKVYGGSNDDVALSACQTTDGGYAVLALTFSNDGNVTGFKGGVDMWLLRIDASGNLLWAKTYGSAAGDNPMSIANTPDHGFIMLGSTTGSDGDVPFHYGGAFSEDWIVIKTDSNGNKEWSKTVGGDGDDEVDGSILAVDNNYFIVATSSSTNHDCTDTSWHTGIVTGYDYHVLKLDTAGNVLWDSSYGGSYDDIVYNAIYDDRDSTIVMTGSSYSSDYMVGGAHGEGDMLTIKVNTNGTLIWQKSLGGHSFDNGKSIIKGPNGGYLICGNTQPNPDTTTGDIGLEDGWLFALSNTGEVIANSIFGGVDYDQPSSVVPYLNGYAVLGTSLSPDFTQGITNCSFANGGAFVSYLSYWPLSVDDVSGNQMQMVISPNPATDRVKISVPVYGKGRIAVSNCIGQVFYTAEIQRQWDDLDIDTREWPAGLYMVKWVGDDGRVVSGKLVVMK